MRYTQLDWCNKQPYGKYYDDIYYSSSGAISEFEHVFFENNDLPARWQKAILTHRPKFTIAELGFGSGINCALTIKAWLQTLKQHKNSHPAPCLHYIAIEKHPLSPADIRSIAKNFSELDHYFTALLAGYPLPVMATHSRLLFDARVQIHFKFMDAEQALEGESYNVDAWYMDGFSPAKNPDLWSETLCRQMANNSVSGATVATYSAAGQVKRHLLSAGFKVNKVKGHNKKREMITTLLLDKMDAEQSACTNSTAFTNKPWFSFQTIKQPVSVAKQAVIIGTGIAGLTAAWSLKQRGWQVSLVDTEKKLASAASGNPAALVSPGLSAGSAKEMSFFSSAFSMALNQLSQLQKLSTEKIWHQCGCYQLVKAKRVKKLFQQQEFSEDFISVVEKKDIPAYFNLADDETLLLFKYAGVVEAEKLCGEIQKQLINQSDDNKASFYVNTITDLSFVNNKWQLVDKKGDIILQAPVVIVANGTGAANLNLTQNFPLQKVRGQVSEIPRNTSSPVVNQAINAMAYVTPVINGKHHAGASYSMDDNIATLRSSDQQATFKKLQAGLKPVFSYPESLSGRVSFRMASPDRFPVIGPMPDLRWYQKNYADIRFGRKNSQYNYARYLPGLYVSLGHGSRGFTTGFLAAEMIAALISDSPLPISQASAELIHPSRFILHEFKHR